MCTSGGKHENWQDDINNHFDNNLKDDVIRYYNKQENYEVDEDW